MREHFFCTDTHICNNYAIKNSEPICLLVRNVFLPDCLDTADPTIRRDFVAALSLRSFACSSLVTILPTRLIILWAFRLFHTCSVKSIRPFACGAAIISAETNRGTFCKHRAETARENLCLVGQCHTYVLSNISTRPCAPDVGMR